MSERRPKNNFAYIDGANLQKAAEAFDWQLDYARLRVWLKEKYDVSNAYMFLGHIPEFKYRYAYLKEIGYKLIFKKITHNSVGGIKGNCDADLILQAVCDTYEEKFEKTVIMTSDGDFVGLARFLKNRNKLASLISPGSARGCSTLLKGAHIPIIYIPDQKDDLEMK